MFNSHCFVLPTNADVYQVAKAWTEGPTAATRLRNELMDEVLREKDTTVSPVQIASIHEDISSRSSAVD